MAALLMAAVSPVNAAEAGTGAPAVAAAGCYIKNVSGDALNVRSGPGTRYTTIGTMAKGGKLPCGVDKDTVTSGQSYSSCGGGNGWMTVKVNGRDGWVAEECVGIGWG
ncbi:SH3 domain-containing protein [Streptomyces sp. BE147]|uniref:SH3 domain-containing protein n=1 Tax=unclassified Streptomyces TaxID=2593676 RepID=UPI002E78519B|nr:SH3 domain-containing protein [Streptomyces sp. BE147]MEE1736893.1 SH3 domain-containing protein [Streptomyces sp. BE147]